jgi:hypothetical protein
MMKQIQYVWLPVTIFFLATLSGCQSASTSVKEISTQTVVPTIINVSTPTETLIPPSPEIVTATPLPTETPTQIPTVTSTIKAVHYGPDRFPKDINPFTGLKVADPAILDRRPVMVKVTNFPPSGRPQYGLSLADLVFEFYIGEGMNRFSAVYYGEKPEKVGPVRSARLADIQLASMYQTIFAYASADARVRVDLLNHLDGLAISVKDSTCLLYVIQEHTVKYCFRGYIQIR